MAEIPSDEALRFLFRLDAFFYHLQGQKSVEYGGGIHTKHRHTRYHDFFAGNIQPTERVLDIGCGVGSLAYDVAEKSGAYVMGIDINPNNIAQAKKRYEHPRVTYLLSDVLQKIPDGPFDVVILSNVLEHLKGRSAFLSHIQDVVRPSRLLIRVPLYERDWRVPLKQELNVEWRLDPTHEVEYSLESFQEEIASAGLRINHREVKWGEIWAVVVPNV
jgi:2-polyprenyl-3-methyl-5-hydroxy-6-metoxy-1,4-benzoquinol methylase